MDGDRPGAGDPNTGQIHKLDPTDVRAHALMHIAVLSQWLANIEGAEGKKSTRKRTGLRKTRAAGRAANSSCFGFGSAFRW